MLSIGTREMIPGKFLSAKNESKIAMINMPKCCRYQQEMSKEEYDHRRRKDFSNEGSRSVMDTMYDKEPLTVNYGGGHRR